MNIFMTSRMPDLGPRVRTTLIALPLVLLAIFFFSRWLLMVSTAVVMLIAAWEWSRLSGITNILSRVIYMVCILWLLYIISVLPLNWTMGAASAFWLLAIGMLVRYAKTKKPYAVILNGAIGAIILPACWQAITLLCFASPRPYYLLALLLLIWIADTVAYFVGCRWGKHKLAFEISPGKSVEGAAAALLATYIIGVIATLTSKFSWSIVLLVMITVIASIIGDLFESMLKRQWGLKDSGKCLPGHGGICDRLDSLMAAAPIFALGLWMMGLI